MRKVPERSTPIINKIIEKLAIARLSTYEFNLIFAIIRKTYGWEKSEDWISMSQFEEITEIPIPHVSRTLKKLFEKKIVKRNGSVWGINKNTDEWLLPKQVRNLPKQVTQKLVTQTGNSELPKQVTTVTQIGNCELPKQVNTKETITKETLTKETITKEIGEKMNFSPPIDDQKDFEKKEPEKSKMKPAQVMREFIKMCEKKDAQFENYILQVSQKKGLPVSVVKFQIEKFVANWTEVARDGKTQKWEKQETFELSHRLKTWWQNYMQWNSPAKKQRFRTIS